MSVGENGRKERGWRFCAFKHKRWGMKFYFHSKRRKKFASPYPYPKEILEHRVEKNS